MAQHATYEGLRRSGCYRDVRTEIESQQDCVCAYCERLFGGQPDRQFSVEHVRPQSRFPNLQTEWSNLIGSCRASAHCGSAKGSRYTCEFLDPVEENPPSFLVMRPTTGRLEPRKGLCSPCRDRATYTIQVLNLNHASLTDDRRNSSKSATATLSSGALTIHEYLAGSPLDFAGHLQASFDPEQTEGSVHDACPVCDSPATETDLD